MFFISSFLNILHSVFSFLLFSSSFLTVSSFSYLLFIFSSLFFCFLFFFHFLPLFLLYTIKKIKNTMQKDKRKLSVSHCSSDTGSRSINYQKYVMTLIVTYEINAKGKYYNIKINQEKVTFGRGKDQEIFFKIIYDIFNLLFLWIIF